MEYDYKKAHNKLWGALIDIIECQTENPNATVRRIISYAEKALIEDEVSPIKPVPRFYQEPPQ